MAEDENRSATGGERLDRVITEYLEAIAAGKESDRRISSASLRLPRFMMVPHKISHLVNGCLGRKRILRDNPEKLKRAQACIDIDISDCPVLAAEYTVRGTDTAAVRRLLTPRAVALLGNVESLCVEGCQDRLLMWREGHVIPVARLEEALVETVSIYGAFAT